MEFPNRSIPSWSVNYFIGRWLGVPRNIPSWARVVSTWIFLFFFSFGITSNWCKSYYSSGCVLLCFGLIRPFGCRDLWPPPPPLPGWFSRFTFSLLPGLSFTCITQQGHHKHNRQLISHRWWPPKQQTTPTTNLLPKRERVWLLLLLFLFFEFWIKFVAHNNSIIPIVFYYKSPPFFVISLPLSLWWCVCVWSIVIGSPPNNNSIPIYIRIWFWFVLS